MKSELYIQLGDKQTDSKILTDTAAEIWKAEGHKMKELSSVKLYFKPDEGKCHYVINGIEKGYFCI